jgi:hypothetical protein
MPKKGPQFDFRWPEPLYKAAVDQAAEEERTLAQFIRWIIRQALQAGAAAQKSDQQDSHAPRQDVEAA